MILVSLGEFSLTRFIAGDLVIHFRVVELIKHNRSSCIVLELVKIQGTPTEILVFLRGFNKISDEHPTPILFIWVYPQVKTSQA